MNRRQTGFTVGTVLLVVVVLALSVAIGWFVWKQNDDAKTDKTTTTNAGEQLPVATFKPEASFSDEAKQEILSKVADPFIYYQEKILKIDMEYVSIKPTPNKMGPDDYQFILEYRDGAGSQTSGFSFGAYNQIGYWHPGLCDEGGCASYPEDFKQKYPLNYQAYLDCEAATEASDKEKMNLVCAP